MDKTTITIAGITVLVFAGILGTAIYNQKNFKPHRQCVSHAETASSIHIHPVLQIVIDNQPVAIPTNIGVEPTCMRALHTHDETGKIHVEYPEPFEFKLGAFFENWGQTFNQQQIMDKKVDDTHQITMTVDGQPNTDFENLILKDAQQIVIRYETKQ